MKGVVGVFFNVNPIFELDILNNKISLFAGALGGYGIAGSHDGAGSGFYFLVNIKAQYNANKKISFGVENKGLIY